MSSINVWHKQNWNISSYSLKFKGGVPIAASSPRTQSEIVEIFMSHKTPYVFHYNPKISASNSLYLGRYSGKCTGYWYTNFDFIMYLHKRLILSVTYIFLPQKWKQGASFRWNFTKCVLRSGSKMCLTVKIKMWFTVTVNHLRVKNTHVKMSTTSLTIITVTGLSWSNVVNTIVSSAVINNGICKV